MALGLVLHAGAGHDAEVAGLGVDGVEAAVGAASSRRCRRRRSRPSSRGSGGISMAKLVLPQARGKAAGDVVLFAGGDWSSRG